MNEYYHTNYPIPLHIPPTPSSFDNIPHDLETELRIYGCELIQKAGYLLKIPQVCMATGQVLFQRFYHNESMKNYDVRYIAMGSLFLASKVEENLAPPRNVIIIFHHLLRPNYPAIEPASQEYWDIKEKMFKAEMDVLRVLGFHTKIHHPHKFILMYAKILNLNGETLQIAWNCANDCLKTQIVIRWAYAPWIVATACIFFAAHKKDLKLPNKWYELFDTTKNQILQIIGELVQLYRRSSPAVWHRIEGCINNLDMLDDQLVSQPANSAYHYYELLQHTTIHTEHIPPIQLNETSQDLKTENAMNGQEISTELENKERVHVDEGEPTNSISKDEIKPIDFKRDIAQKEERKRIHYNEREGSRDRYDREKERIQYSDSRDRHYDSRDRYNGAQREGRHSDHPYKDTRGPYDNKRPSGRDTRTDYHHDKDYRDRDRRRDRRF